jgi:hypothetical protein
MLSAAGDLTGALEDVEAGEFGGAVSPARRMLASLSGATIYVNELRKTQCLLPYAATSFRYFLLFSSIIVA